MLALALICGLGACGNQAAEQQAAEAAALRADSSAAELLTHLEKSIADGRPNLARAFAEDSAARFPNTPTGRALATRLQELRAAAM